MDKKILLNGDEKMEARITIELKKGNKSKIMELAGAEAKGVGITHEYIYCKEGSIRINGVKVKGNAIKVYSNVVEAGFIEIRDCYEVNYPDRENKKYLGKSYDMGETTARLPDTTTNSNALDTLSFTKMKGKKEIKYTFIMKEYI